MASDTEKTEQAEATSVKSTREPPVVHGFIVFLATLLFSAVAGTVAGRLMWQATAYLIDNHVALLHPEIQGATEYYLGIFLWDVVVVPLIFVALIGVVVPVVYGHHKMTGCRPINVVKATAWISIAFCLIVTLEFLRLGSFPTLLFVNIGILCPLLIGCLFASLLFMNGLLSKCRGD